MYKLYEYVNGMWLLVNSFRKLKSAVYNALQLHDNGEKVKIEDRDGNDLTSLIWEQ